MHRIKNVSLFLLLGLTSPFALAAKDTVPWLAFLLGVMANAMIIGAWLAFRNPKAESTMAKLLLTGLYFWVITFAELIVLSVIYYFTK